MPNVQSFNRGASPGPHGFPDNSDRERRVCMATKQDQFNELQKKNLEAAMRLAQLSI